MHPNSDLALPPGPGCVEMNWVGLVACSKPEERLEGKIRLFPYLSWSQRPTPGVRFHLGAHRKR